MKRDYKEKWWDNSFIKRLYDDRKKPVTVKRGFMFIGFFIICAAGRACYG